MDQPIKRRSGAPWLVCAVAALGCNDESPSIPADGLVLVEGPLIGVPNLDDDDENGKYDWYDAPFPDDDDLHEFVIPADAFRAFGSEDRMELRLQGPIGPSIRFWHNGVPVLGHDGQAVQESYALLPGDTDEVFQVEFLDYLQQGQLQIQQVDSVDQVVNQVEIQSMSAPLILNHHLQPTEHVWAVSVPPGSGGANNAAFVQAYEDILGGRFSTVHAVEVDYDVWMQDEVEFGISTAPDGTRLNTVVDSIRNLGLASFAEEFRWTPDFVGQTWGPSGGATTFDSFGNLEISPPVTVDGVEYPFGRIYVGRSATTPWARLNNELFEFLRSQKIQAPIEIDTAWLCVGHVDEFMAFIPDPNHSKGFRLLFADVPAGYALLDLLDPNLQLPRYGADYGYPTVGDLAGDVGLRALNQDLQADWLDPIRAQVMHEFGLTEEDVVSVPSLFENLDGCGAVALIPGMVNLVVTNVPDEPTYLFIPDPFVRADDGDQSADPFIAEFSSLLPEAVQPIYIDNWYIYHLGLGEVHCGTNVMRTPISDWWETGNHLLEAD